MFLAPRTVLRTLAFVPLALSLASAQEGEEWDVSKLDASKLPAAAEKEGLSYEKDILPMLQESCVNCHGERRQRGEFRLDSLEALLKGGEHGKAVVPGDAAKSPILFAAAQLNEDIAMPPKRRGRGPGGPGGEGRAPRPGRPGNAEAPQGPGESPAPSEVPTQTEPGNGPATAPPGERPRGPQGQGRQGRGQPAKPLTAEQVGILRAWIEQGAK